MENQKKVDGKKHRKEEKKIKILNFGQKKLLAKQN